MVNGSSRSTCAPSAASPVSWLRLVTSTRQPGLPGQKSAHLRSVARVVEDDKDPHIRQHAAVQRSLVIHV